MSQPEYFMTGIYGDGMVEPATYDKIIEELKRARAQMLAIKLGVPQKGCSICYEPDHTAEKCPFNLLQLAANQGSFSYRCFHCGFVARSPEDAERHFGPTPHHQTGCMEAMPVLKWEAFAQRVLGARTATSEAGQLARFVLDLAQVVKSQALRLARYERG